jgi:hypothetical protein
MPTIRWIAGARSCSEQVGPASGPQPPWSDMGCFFFRDLCIQPHGQFADPRPLPDPGSERSGQADQEAHAERRSEHRPRPDAELSSESREPERAGGMSETEPEEVSAESAP